MEVVNNNVMEENDKREVEISEQIPQAGMILDSEEKLHTFYNKYGYEVGFGVRKISTKTKGEVKYYTLACSRGGKYVCKANSSKIDEQLMQFDKLCANFYEVAHMANSRGKYDFLKELIDKAKERLKDIDLDNSKKITTLPCIDHATKSSEKLLSPLQVRSKGRPSSKRKESKVEKIIKTKKKNKEIFLKTHLLRLAIEDGKHLTYAMSYCLCISLEDELDCIFVY
ncbi:unnamed protein product [Lupinus luteus]|uniref:Protein FAR1-RELATED SEQUENCE n=1 Tax=Lupinus luteus TaxID=3873 RepID=A0AAV1XMJ4_LUPLU